MNNCFGIQDTQDNYPVPPTMKANKYNYVGIYTTSSSRVKWDRGRLCCI